MVAKEVNLHHKRFKSLSVQNRIVMAQRKHLDDFYVVELLDDWKVDVPSWKYPRNLESPSLISRLWQRFQDYGNLQSDSRRILIWRAPDTRYRRTPLNDTVGGARWFVWRGIILGSRERLTCMFRV
ncbi:DDE_3 domain-containing protein [Trichonephila clavipes]|nr:DDE_3 domain-containing protein [Trichonephila clavipes]